MVGATGIEPVTLTKVGVRYLRDRWARFTTGTPEASSPAHPLNPDPSCNVRDRLYV